MTITSQTIADAGPDELRALANQVLLLHQPVQNEGTPIPICAAGCHLWPCATARALETTLGGGR